MKNLIFPLMFFTGFAAYAQKLPIVQQKGLRAPAHIKADGKSTEWNNKFQAYNKATDVFYTLSNDNNKLYLILQATDRGVINKIINGGASFTINRSVKKITNDAVTISYPVFNRKNRPYLNLVDEPETESGSASSLKTADSLMNINNLRMADKSKFIKVTGIKDMDTLISVYNMDGIKAASLFNNKMVYTYELAIDLKLAGLSIKEHPKFYYNIRLNAIEMDDVPGIKVGRKEDGTITSIDIDKKVAGKFGNSVYATDFWGEYTLAK